MITNCILRLFIFVNASAVLKKTDRTGVQVQKKTAGDGE